MDDSRMNQCCHESIAELRKQLREARREADKWKRLFAQEVLKFTHKKRGERRKNAKR